MHQKHLKGFWLIALVLLLALVPMSATAQGPDYDPDLAPGNSGGHRQDNLKHPLGAKQFSLRQKALKDKLNGKAQGKVHQVAKGQYVELSLERTDRVFVILAEFGASIHPTYGGTAGPAHNEIAQPNRTVDNTTIWQADFNKAHYENMYFTKMVDYYRSQSSGRYTINGAVTEWVKVPYNEARYGSNLCGSNVCSTVWYLIRDAINIWTMDRLASGMSHAQIKAYLATFDQWDRYDADGDGNFDEPDGYIDHFQIVHAGEGEETGGGAQGAQAIWSHRWYTAYQGIGVWGPPNALFGGMEFGGAGTFGNLGGPNAVGVWVGDYTMQPENGGLGVFAHEYAHDLGLPDAYDTAGGENSTGFWTLMSSGSYLGDGTVDLGSRPGDLNAWEKFQLGWLSYDVAFAGKNSSHRLGPAETNTKAVQGLFVVLPDKQRQLVLATPPQGTMAWWSGMGDNLDNNMTRSVSVPGGSPALTMQVWYDIELDWDYAYVEVSTNGGASWASVAGNITTNTSPNGQNFGNGITGSSGGWVTASFDMSAYAGQTVLLRLRYWTDGFVQGKGFMADNIVLGSFSDGAESSPNGWTLNGFKATTGLESSFHFNAYVAEYRQYRSYDTGLQTGPYNFGFLNTKPDWVEHFPYQDGLLISYWDSSMADNNTSVHPGEGLILPIDAHPTPLLRPNSTPWRSRVQAYDSTFGLQPTDAITLHVNGIPSPQPSLPAVPKFNDLNNYWFATAPLASVNVPKTGTTIEVISVNTQGNFSEVHVKPAK
jgi:immune inhibitor A